MRPTADLADLPYAFTQSSLLLPEQFVKELSKRGLAVTPQELEDYHRLGLLIPLLRVGRSRARLQKASRGPWLWDMVAWNPTSPKTLAQSRNAGLLYDPASERFVSSARRQRQAGDRTIPSSVGLYSPYQTIYAPLIGEARPFVASHQGQSSRAIRLKVPRFWGDLWLRRSRELRDVVIGALAMEANYLPSIVGTIRLDVDADADEFEEWRFRRPVKQILRWLGVKPEWLSAAGAGLLRTADQIDPLGRWSELLAHADPGMWDELTGNARLALDLRLAAELFLRYYDRLVEARQAPRLTKSSRRERGQFDRRLNPQRTLDEVLTSFGLSPHPRLVLVVEGETEYALMPRALALVIRNRDEDVISIQNAEGVRTDLRPLMALVAPRLIDPGPEARHLDLARPMTRVMVVFDAEHPVADDAAREKRRQTWVDRMLRALPVEHRTEAIRRQLDLVVVATTWNSKGDNFEFAHFTPLQLARAIVALVNDRPLPGHRRPPDLTQTKQRVTDARDNHRNLKSLIPGGSKTRLAEQLWPVLERRIIKAIEAKTEKRIPIVRVLDEAVLLAYEFPRRGLVLRRGDDPHPTA